MIPEFRIRSRTRLLVMIAGVQVIALVVGGLCLYQMARHQLVEKLREHIYAENIQVANMVTDLLAEFGVGRGESLEYGGSDWERAQSLVERTKLPSGAFVCILDEEGSILCHPDMRTHPALRDVNLRSKILRTSKGAIPLDSLDPDRSVNGEAEFGLGQTHFVTTRMVPGTGLRLLVHQPEAGLASISDAMTSGMAWVALGMMIVIVGLTVLVNTAMFRRYEGELDGINKHLEDEVRQRTRDSVARLHTLIHGLAALADHRDNDTGAHLERICAYSCLLAESLRDEFPVIDDDWISCLRLAASMHDIGKVGVPDSVLLKPGKLNDDDWVEIRKHPVIGARTLIVVREEIGEDPMLDMAIDITRGHHERWDGKGYPDKMPGHEIPLSARIVALADVYDALTSKRVYKPAIPHDRSVEIICEGRGTQFDPKVVDAFMRAESAFRSIHKGLQGSLGDSTFVVAPKAAA